MGRKGIKDNAQFEKKERENKTEKEREEETSASKIVKPHKTPNCLVQMA